MEVLVPVLQLGGGLLGLGLSLGLLFPSTRLAAHTILTGSLSLPSLEWEVSKLLWLTGDEVVVRFSWQSFSISISVRRASIDLEGDPSDNDSGMMNSWLSEKRGPLEGWLAHLAKLMPLPRLILTSPRLEIIAHTDFGALSAHIEALHLRYRYPSDVELSCSIRVMCLEEEDCSLPLFELTHLDMHMSSTSCSMEIDDCLLFIDSVASPEVLLQLRAIIIKLLSIITCRRLLNSEMQDFSSSDVSTPYFDAHSGLDVRRSSYKWSIALRQFTLAHLISGTIRKSLSIQGISSYFNVETVEAPSIDCRISVSDLALGGQEPFLEAKEDIFELAYSADGASASLSGRLLPCRLRLDLSTLHSAIRISNMIAGMQTLVHSPRVHQHRIIVPTIRLNFVCSEVKVIVASEFQRELAHVTLLNLSCTNLADSSLALTLDSCNVGVMSATTCVSFIQITSIRVSLVFTPPTIPLSADALSRCRSAVDWRSLQDATPPAYHIDIDAQALVLRLNAAVLWTISDVVNALFMSDRRTGLTSLRMDLAGLRAWSAKLEIADMRATLLAEDSVSTEVQTALGGACTVFFKGLEQISRTMEVYLNSGRVDVLGRSAQSEKFEVASFDLRNSCLITSRIYPAETFIQSAASPNTLTGLIRYISITSFDIISVRLNLLSSFLNPIVLTLVRFSSHIPTPNLRTTSLLTSAIASYELSVEKVSIIFSRNHEFGRFSADTLRLNTVSHGPLLSRTLFQINNPTYTDIFYPDSKFKVLLSTLEENAEILIELMYISHPTLPPFLCLNVSQMRFVYLQRAMMTFVSFLQELFHDSYGENNTMDRSESSAQHSTRIQITGRVIECILPVNSFSNDGLVIIAETVNLWFPGSSIGRPSSLRSDSEASEMLLNLCKQAMHSHDNDYFENIDRRFSHISESLPDVTHIPPRECNDFEYSLANSTICSLCNQNAIATRLSLEGMFSVAQQSAISEGIYVSVADSLGFDYCCGGEETLSSVTVRVIAAETVDLVLAQGQYLVCLVYAVH